jgi:hypothetical protein
LGRGSQIASLAFLGFLAAGILSLFGRPAPKPGPDDLKRADFAVSTQRLGIRFSEKIRNAFRFKWLKAQGRCSRDTAQHEQSDRIQ